MRILGIDPGSIKLGYGLIESTGTRHAYIEAGTLEEPERVPRSQRIVNIGSDLEALLLEHRPDLVAIETAKWGGFPSAAGALAEARGIVLWLAYRASAQVVDLEPSKIRSTIGIGGDGTKDAAGRMVQRVLRMRTTPGPDVGDALAVALACALLRRGSLAIDRQMTGK